MVRHLGSSPFSLMYSRKLGMLRAFHLEVEFREMLISSWLMKGLLKRSCTAAANCIRSSLSRGRVGMTSSYSILFMNSRMVSLCMQSRTMS